MGDVQPRWLSAKSAAAYLDLKSVKTLYAWAADGTIKGVVRIHRRNPKGNGRGRHVCTLRVDRLALDRWLEGRAR